MSKHSHGHSWYVCHDSIAGNVVRDGKTSQMVAECRNREDGRLIAAAPEMKALVDKAVSILGSYIIPDSQISESDVVNEMLGLFDGQECRAALAKADGDHSSQGRMRVGSSDGSGRGEEP